MTTQLFHNIKRLLKTVKYNVNETKGIKRPELIKVLEVSQKYNKQKWKTLSETQQQEIITWWEKEWGETIYESHQDYCIITEDLFLKFFTAENYSL